MRRKLPALDGWPALVIVLAPFVVAAVCLVTASHFITYDDIALIELRTRDVGGLWPILGPYSRFSWVHPGPMLFYGLVLPYRLFGSDGRALWLAALGINVVAVVGIVAAARRGGVALLWTTTGALMLLVVGLGPATVGDPWNPDVTLLPFLFFVLVAWRLMCGSSRALPVAVVVATFLVQSHVGYALTVTATMVVALIGFVVVRRRAAVPGPGIRAHVWIAVAMFVALWALPLADQFAGHGNLGAILDYFTSPARTAGWHKAFYVVFDQLAKRPRWLAGQNTFGLFSGNIDSRGPVPVPVLLVPFLVGAVYAGIRRWWDLVRLAVLTLLGLVTATIAVAQVRGPLAPYLVRWTAVVGALVVVVPIAVLARALLATRVARVVTGVLVAGTIAAAVWAAVDVTAVVPPRRNAFQANAASVDRVVDRIAAATEGRRPVLVRSRPASATILTVPTLVLELERRGIDTAVPADRASWFGDARGDRRHRAGTEVVVADLPGAAAALQASGFARIGALERRVGPADVFLRPLRP